MKLIIAGGGTGGHLFSGIAVAEEWVSRGGSVVFVGTPRGIEKDLVPRFGYPLKLIASFSLKGGGLLPRLKTLCRLPGALLESFFLLKKEDPDVVLGIGGYASGPFVLAACFKGYPSALVEQNSLPGLTNRILGFFTNRVFLTFDETAHRFKRSKVRIYGNPVMRARKPLPPLSRKEGITLLICGGSQGAHVLNQTFLGAADSLLKIFPALKIVHQTGQADYEAVRKEWQQRGVCAVVAPFFDRLEEHYARATLVVSRAGSGALTELALWGLPSLLIPYPYAADDHQKYNAEIFSKRGAAEVLFQKDLTAETLSAKIASLLSNQERLRQMSEKAKTLAKPDAAKDVVNELMNLVAT